MLNLWLIVSVVVFSGNMSRAGVAAITGNVDVPSPAKPGSMEEAIRTAYNILLQLI